MFWVKLAAIILPVSMLVTWLVLLIYIMLLNDGDKRFLDKALVYFNIDAVQVCWSDYSKRRYPDIWCMPWENPPKIVVTAEWSRQRAPERRKRLTHEMLHLIGMEHNEKIGYNTIPSHDAYSMKVYKDIIKVMG